MDRIVLAENTENSWKGLLQPGEEILWHGRPASGFHLDGLGGLGAWIGSLLLLAGIILVDVGNNQAPFLQSWGGPMAFAGLATWLAPSVWRAWQRRSTYYTLTNRRAFIARRFPRRRLEARDLTQDTWFQLEGGTEVGSVLFYAERSASEDGPRHVQRGFEHIAGAREVYDLMASRFAAPDEDRADG